MNVMSYTWYFYNVVTMENVWFLMQCYLKTSPICSSEIRFYIKILKIETNRRIIRQVFNVVACLWYLRLKPSIILFIKTCQISSGFTNKYRYMLLCIYSVLSISAFLFVFSVIKNKSAKLMYINKCRKCALKMASLILYKVRSLKKNENT